MALHNLSPRQKMINMMYLVLTALLALNVTAEVLNAFKTVDDGIRLSNVSLETKNATLFAAFDKQMQLDETKTAPYQTKALQAKALSEQLYQLLEKYKQQLIVEAGGIDLKTGQLKKNDNIDIATHLFVENEQNGKDLKEKILATRTQLLALVEESERSKISHAITLNIDESKTGKSWEYAKFNNVPVVAAVTLLSKYQNDVLTSESQIAEHLYGKIDQGRVSVDRLAALVSSPSNYIMQGLAYKANVMLTAYSSTQNPDVFIGTFTRAVKKGDKGQYSEIVSLSETPPLVNATKLDVSNGLGKIEMPGNGVGERKYTGVVRIKNPDGGGYKFYPFDGEYQVAAKTAVVSPTMMNVLYVGLENPIDISVPGVAQKDVLAAFNGAGTLVKKADGSYIAKVSAPGQAKVQVSANVGGKMLAMGEQQFRLKRVPNPNASIDGFLFGGRVTKAQLRERLAIIAKVDGFDFSVPFRVTSFEFVYREKDLTISKVAITGNQFDSRIKQIIDKKISKGDAIFIDEINVSGPDGNRKINGIAFNIVG